MDTTEAAGDHAAALALIRELARNSYGYIAEALNRRGIPSGPKGPRWHRGSVFKLARQHGIKCGMV